MSNNKFPWRPTLKATLAVTLPMIVAFIYYKLDIGEYNAAVYGTLALIVLFLMYISINFTETIEKLLDLYQNFQTVRALRPTNEKLIEALKKDLERENL